MEILTDDFERIGPFFGRSSSSFARAADAGGPLDETLMRGIFGGDAGVERVRVPGLRLPGRFGPVLIQGRARRSNLEALTGLQRSGAPLPDGLVCVALEGAGFLGRFDRGWKCLAGNLHAVVHLAPRITPERAGPAFSILAAVACVDAVNRAPAAGATAAVPLIKWVNDVVAGPRKVAGALTRQTFLPPIISDVLLGIGVNVLADPELGSPGRNPFVPAGGSLAGVYGGRGWTPGAFLLDWLAALDGWYAGMLERGAAELIDFYRRHSSVLGRRVRIFEDGFGFENKPLEARRLVARGTVRAIRDDLSIEIAECAAPISVGRLAFEEDCVEGP